MAFMKVLFKKKRICVFFLLFLAFFSFVQKAEASHNIIDGLVERQNNGTLDTYLNKNAGGIKNALSHLDLAELQYLHDNLSPAQLQKVITIAGGEKNLTFGNQKPNGYGEQDPIQGTFPDDGRTGTTQERKNALLTGNPNPTPPTTSPPTTPPDATGTTPPVTSPAGVKGGPFGGAILIPPIRCDNGSILVKIGPPTPGFYLWTLKTKSYENGPPVAIGQCLLGMALVTPVPCTVGGKPVGKPGLPILFHGSSPPGPICMGATSSGFIMSSQSPANSACSGGSCPLSTGSCTSGTCGLGSGSGIGSFGSSIGSSGSGAFGGLQGMLVNLAGGVLGNILGKLGQSSSQNNSSSGTGTTNPPSTIFMPSPESKPFGGAVLSLAHCDNGVLVKIGSPTPGLYLWQSNPLNGLVNPPRPIGYLKGTASVSTPCLVGNTISGRGLLMLSMTQIVLGQTLP
ncbi:MAG: hypothetical protein PHS53_01550 [Candidatus Pacebacteria bacterium]|nr:hypothetical protein [Candidatus Paceibacterota bacterium]MDD5356814.1 hypothetical protein [Candidatus Paceibacterota bacterium]